MYGHTQTAVHIRERRREEFPGSAALEDLARCVGDRPAASRVLARYAVTRITFRAMAGIVKGSALSRDLEIAGEYVDAITPVDDAERRGLRRALRLLRDLAAVLPDEAGAPEKTFALARALSRASREAARRSAPGGARALDSASRRVRGKRDGA